MPNPPELLKDSFQFCPRCGTANTQPGNNPLRCHHCEFVYYFSPIAAVGAIIVDDANRILFVIRGKDPGKGQLGLPGGFVDPGETLEQSVRREVSEETSLEVTDSHYLCSYPNPYNYRGVQVSVIDSFFVCTVESLDSLQPQAGEVDSFCRVLPSEKVLQQIAFPSNRWAVEFFLKTNPE